jgi:hypothetical protein
MAERSDGSGYVAEVRKIVCDTFLLDPGQVRPDTPIEELGIDSKRRIRLLATLEVYYDIAIIWASGTGSPMWPRWRRCWRRHCGANPANRLRSDLLMSKFSCVRLCGRRCGKRRAEWAMSAATATVSE